jgi:phosphocarrier protein
MEQSFCDGNVGVVEREAVIRNREGLHFRPIMQLVDTASQYPCRVTLQVEDRTADARSPMELLMLVATCGTKLKLTEDGESAQEALEAIVRLIDMGFGES